MHVPGNVHGWGQKTVLTCGMFNKTTIHVIL